MAKVESMVNKRTYFLRRSKHKVTFVVEFIRVFWRNKKQNIRSVLFMRYKRLKVYNTPFVLCVQESVRINIAKSYLTCRVSFLSFLII